jgi:predicted SAM-dependent methyltransferase
MSSVFKRFVTGQLVRRGYVLSRLPVVDVAGVEHVEVQTPLNAALLERSGATKAHYGSGTRLLTEGWVNLDLVVGISERAPVSILMDLTRPHPLPDACFEFAYAEDFIEHREQEEALTFLAEVHRALLPGGVVRLATPGLRGVLAKHFSDLSVEGVLFGRNEAYAMWGHRHFFCEESIELVARHLGFSDVTFVKFGESEHEQLRGLESRPEQCDLNIYVELTK